MGITRLGTFPEILFPDGALELQKPGLGTAADGLRFYNTGILMRTALLRNFLGRNRFCDC